MSCKPFKTSEANAKAYLKTQGAIDNFLNIKDLNTFRKENAKLKEQAKNKYFPNVQGWNEKLFFENREGTKAIPNKKVFKQIDNINGIYYSPTEQLVKTEKTVNSLAKATYFKDSDTKKASDVFTEISKSNYPLNKLAEKLLPYVKANDVNIELSNETFKFNLEDGTETTAAGVYDNNNNKVLLFKNEYFNNIEKLIIHEVLHSISAYQLKQDTETNNDFKKLFDYAKEKLPKSYELENMDEFLVGIFTDSKFIKELQKLPAIEVKKYKNFLEEVINYLLSLMKLKKGSTLYEQAFDIATNILEESKQYSEMMKDEEEYMRKQIEEINNYSYSPAKEQKIKPGVSELFESNPELANSVYEVYEALELSKKLDFYEGDTLAIDEKTYSIVEKISSKELAKRNGLTISSNIPVYIVKEFLGARKGGYDTVNNIIILSENSDKETIHHELIHSVEYNLDKNELIPLYEKVKDSITEDSFSNFVSWNFKKSISEFVADALSKKVFRDALKKEGLLKEVDDKLSVYTSKITPQQKQQALQLYSQYLDTIFPQNTIVYRGSEKGRTQFNTRGFFTEKLSYAKEYAFDKGFVAKSGEGIVNTFLINTANVKNVGEINTKSVENETQDSVLKGVDKGRARESGVVYATTSKNLHELGSKQDIKGFKEFVESKQEVKKETTETQKFYKGGKSTADEFFVTPNKEYAKQYGEVSEVDVELGNVLDLTNDYTDGTHGSGVVNLLESKGVTFTEQEKQNIKNNNLSIEPLFSIIGRNPEIKAAVKRSGFNSIKQLETKTTDKYGRWDDSTLTESYFILSKPKTQKDTLSLTIEKQIDDLIRKGIIKSKCD